jgi:dethiobiotin synthetase
MLIKPPLGLFITGTDTDVGKTYVAALIVKTLVNAGHRVGIYKPCASDCVVDRNQLVSEDALVLWNAAGRPLDLGSVCPQRFRSPMAPHLAARSEGRQLDAQFLRGGISAWADHCDIVVVEGTGGLMSPISDDEFTADLAFDFGYPLILVAANSWGVINQTLQSLITATCFRDGLDVAGIVLNDSQLFEGDVTISTNLQEITQRSRVPVLTRIRYEATEIEDDIDWFSLASRRDSNSPLPVSNR